MANVELRICPDMKYPSWGFVADGMFYPFGPTDKDKSKAAEHARNYKSGDQGWRGYPLSQCGPNLDSVN